MPKPESLRDAHSCQRLCFLLSMGTIFDCSEGQKLLLSMKIDVNISNASVSLFFFFFSVCRNIIGMVFATVVSSGLKSLDTVCLPLSLFCEI